MESVTGDSKKVRNQNDAEDVITGRKGKVICEELKTT